MSDNEYEHLRQQYDAIREKERLAARRWWCALCRHEMGTLPNGEPDADGHGVGECVTVESMPEAWRP